MRAGKYDVESARFQGTGCVLATGAQLSSGCPVRLAFLVDGASFAQQRKFHQLARNTAFVPGGPHIMSLLT